jgi:predicted methyltransferase
MDITFPIFLGPPQITILKNPEYLHKTVSLELSLDLGKSRCRLRLEKGKILHIRNQLVEIPADILTSPDERTIYINRGQKWEKWQQYDSNSDRFYKMVFVKDGAPPTVEISGIKMHITKDGDPQTDTENKLKTVKHIHGKLLDTCLGLGYTSISAAKLPRVKSVLVCEKDPVILRLCRENPWSADVFTSSKIQVILEPAEDFVENLPDSFFNTIIHDPPRFALAPQLYSGDFYSQIYRILKAGGEFYHYTGNPNQATRRQSLAQKTNAILQDVGFGHVQQVYAGVLARK